MDPVHIFVDQQELIGWTSMRLERKKEDMTGKLTIDIFMGYLPAEPVLPQTTTGGEIWAYVGGQLAFTGFIDVRSDQSATIQGRDPNGQFNSNTSEGGDPFSLNVGPNSYTVTLTCRGKTKFLIDSSQQHPTGTMLRPTNKSIFETLISPWSVDLLWEADTIELDKQRFRDGGAVSDELQRVGEQCSLYMFETRDGKLRVMDGPGTVQGESLVLGTNILQFASSQSVAPERDVVTVKGQLINKDVWGVPAVLPTIQGIRDTLVNQFTPYTVKLYGNGTEELLTKRGQYEANRRSAKSKEIQVTVFYILQTDGTPWDLATLHFVSIPPAGINGTFEVVALEYQVDGGSVSTTLTLSPPPAKLETTATTDEFLGEVPPVTDTPTGLSPETRQWLPPELELVYPTEEVAAVTNRAQSDFLEVVEPELSFPPLELPAGYTTPTAGAQ